MVISTFDPWRSHMCTCPPKYSFNPYTGCGHGCIYCYSTYIPRFFQERAKKDVRRQFERGLMKLEAGSLLSISNSSDPYTPLEREQRITRHCLDILRHYNLRILCITKSDLITRDIDLLKKLRAGVTISITTLDSYKAQTLEPNAPSPQRRLAALSELAWHGIGVGVRFDPLFPGLTDNEIPDMIRAAKEHGASHVTTSTFKPRPDGWKRFCAAFPACARAMASKAWTRVRGSYYLPEAERHDLIERVRTECRAHGLSCASCREGFGLQAESCDGSHLIP